MTRTEQDSTRRSPREIAAALSPEQQASLVTGADFWTTTEIPAADIPSILLADGPHGLRRQRDAGDHLGIAASEPATCFPPAVALGSSFDADLIGEVGSAIGREARQQGVAVVLGPGMNIKRSPLCGRNFEYFSEDPLVSGELAAAMVRGIQSQGVGASVKHFAANNQEHDRMRASSDVDPRTLREIYLRGFERVVTGARPWTVMCSYNRINGVYAAEDPHLLTEVLREEWGFQGMVVSDWFAVGDRVASLRAGLDLEMPGTGDSSRRAVLGALESGELDGEDLERAAARVIETVHRAESGRREPAGPVDTQEHHALARRAATRSAVLLRNEGGLLPLSEHASLAVIGEFARTPRYQGSGSSQINPTALDAALDAISGIAQAPVRFAPGFTLDGSGDESGDAAGLRREAAEAAAASDVAVVFLGLPDAEESEGFDRAHMDLPAAQLAVLEEVLEANPRTVVVLSNGGAVALPFAEEVPAILEGWLLGQAGGTALADLLFGRANPSGRLTETIPRRLADTPAYLNFPGEHGHVRYGEGVFVGYRWYDARELEVAFPFGHGLSYTAFEYTELQVDVLPGDAGGGLLVSVTVTNTGERDGHDVVQAYIGRRGPGSEVARAPRELKAFSVTELAAGESRTVRMQVDRQDLAYWDVRAGDWVVEGGEYDVVIGATSRDVRLSARVTIDGDALTLPLTRASTLGDALAHPRVGPALRVRIEDAAGRGDTGGIFTAEGLIAMLGSFPLGRLTAFPLTGLEESDIDRLIEDSA